MESSSAWYARTATHNSSSDGSTDNTWGALYKNWLWPAHTVASAPASLFADPPPCKLMFVMLILT